MPLHSFIAHFDRMDCFIILVYSNFGGKVTLSDHFFCFQIFLLGLAASKAILFNDFLFV